MIALDLSRLLSRARFATPTGIDRVELAYARHLAASGRPHCFVARTALDRIGLLPAVSAADLVARLARLWRDGAAPDDLRRIARQARRLRLAALIGGDGAAYRELGRTRGRPVYLSVSHAHLDRAAPIARLKTATGARMVCLIHDLIPLDFPQLTRPRQPTRHRRRIATVGRLADAVIVNSAATGSALSARLAPAPPPITVAPLGIDPPPRAGARPVARPYFVCVGTIEPRKNQGLLLDLWRQIGGELGDRAPRLLLVGRRGYGSEPITAKLVGLRAWVGEHSDLPDMAMAALLRGARALLLPSLAEGFGLPLAEALALGVPVLCSDLPALRETGGGVPEYLDPADAPGWRRTILDYLPDSPRRTAQIARLAAWRPPCWQDHFAVADRVIAGLP